MKTKKSIPLDLFADMAITFDKLADKFNCNDNQLEDYDLDWGYFHKINRRAKYILDNLKDYED